MAKEAKKGNGNGIGFLDSIKTKLILIMILIAAVPLSIAVIVSYNTSTSKALEDAARSYLENYPRRLLDDDKTIVVIYNPLQPAKRMPAEYYEAPNWVALQEEAKAKLYDSSNETREHENKASSKQSSDKANPPSFENELDKRQESSPDAHIDVAAPDNANGQPRAPDTKPVPILCNPHTQASNAHTPTRNEQLRHDDQIHWNHSPQHRIATTSHRRRRYRGRWPSHVHYGTIGRAIRKRSRRWPQTGRHHDSRSRCRRAGRWCTHWWAGAPIRNPAIWPPARS